MNAIVRRTPGPSTAPSSPGGNPWLSRPGLWVSLLLGGILVILFCKSFEPGWIIFVNDTTLGQMMAAPNHLPGAFAGTWHYGPWVGIQGPAAPPSISSFLTMVLTPEIFLKVYAPFSLFFLGICAWVFFRQLQFHPAVCLLGGLAAGLNMHFFSVACWGQGSWNIAAGMIFLALAALSSKSIKQPWARAILAGLAVGVNLMEGFDVGVILSVYLGIFILYKTLAAETTAVKKVTSLFSTEALVILFAGLISAHAILSLVGTQVVGVVGTGQDEQTREQRWNPATQWSLPKLETLRVIAPGLFGYRMAGRITTPDKSSAYWGNVGRDWRLDILNAETSPEREKLIRSLDLPPALRSDLLSADRPTRDNAIDGVMKRPSTISRYSGSGEYGGMLVAFLAIFGLTSAWRKTPFSRAERLAVCFWGGAALFSLLASWGRHAFFYRLLYELPYVSTIRNPIKFMHPFHLAWVILAAYGLEAIWRQYLQSTTPQTGFEKKWTTACAGLIIASLIGLYAFIMWKPHLIEYLQQHGFADVRAFPIAGFAVAEAGWAVFWLVVSAALLVAVIKGIWKGPQSKTAWILMGLVMVADLMRADAPWIHYFDYSKEYVSNTVTDLLSDKPYEHRITCRLSPKGLGSGIGTPIGQQYDYWQQNIFPYYRIQSLDFAQWPRTPRLDASYMTNFALHGDDLLHCDFWPTERLWELTNTRYVLTSTAFLPLLNKSAEPGHELYVNTYLKVIQKPDVASVEDAGDLTVIPEKTGSYALLELSNSLPRAKLYSRWQTLPTDNDTLRLLDSRDFNPAQTVLISPETPVGQTPGPAAGEAGDVNITDYQPKRVQLEAHVTAPSVLLFNDRVAPGWTVAVDKKDASMLRCNYIMRGVFLTPGDHRIEFRFQPPVGSLYVSLCGWAAGLLTSGYLIYSRTPAPKPAPAPAPAPMLESEPVKPVTPKPVAAARPKKRKK